MSKSIKKFCLVICITCSCMLYSGCTTSKPYHEGSGKEWIMEQVEKGNLTQEQADLLLKQEKD